VVLTLGSTLPGMGSRGKLRVTTLTMTDRYGHLASDQAAIIQERVARMDKLDVKPMRVPKAR
jgi:hypothetical protein